MNKEVSYPLAKLLNEKGFNKECSKFYTNPRCKMFGIDEHGRYYPLKNKAKNLWIIGNAATLDSRHVYYAPTIAEVVMWLYEKHGIWIEVIETDLFNKFFFQIKRKDNTRLKNGDYNSTTEAYEVGIEYVLTNLI